MGRRTDPEREQERRRLFRQMEWVFVYAPPILAVFFGVFGAVFLAWLIPVPGTEFWERWLALVGLILVLPALVYFGRDWWRNR